MDNNITVQDVQTNLNYLVNEGFVKTSYRKGETYYSLTEGGSDAMRRSEIANKAVKTRNANKAKEARWARKTALLTR